MAILIKGTDFTDGDQVTAVKLDALVDSATFASGAVDASTTALSGGAIIVKDLGVTAAKLETATNGQLMIGNGTGFTKAALTAGTNISVTNASGAVTLGLTGTVAAANGGTGAATLTANNVLLGNGTSAVQFVAPGTSGNLLTSNGTTWASSIPSGGISSAGATITTNTTLTAASPGYQPIAMTALGQSVTLPNATTVSVGSPKFYLNNASGAYPVGIRNTSGTLLMAIAAGGTAFVSCQDITTAAGVWNITGNNLQPALLTISSLLGTTFSGTLATAYAVLDDNKSIHCVQSSTSGFSVVAVDNTTGAVGTPVVVSASAVVPKIMFKITTTTAIVFYGNTTSGTLIGAVVSLSGATTLTVGTASSTLTDVNVGVEGMIVDPKIAQLSTTLYLVSYGEDTVDNSVAAFQVSGGTAVNLGTAVTLGIAADALAGTTTYALTATTGLVLYKRGTAAPYTNYGVVVSVTNANPPVCTVATAVSMTGVTSTVSSRPVSCLLSSTKCLIEDNNNVAGSIIVNVFTISSTTITVGTLVSVETGLVTNVLYANRYRPVLFPLTTTTAFMNYVDATGGMSRALVLTEAATVVTAGTITYGSISRAASGPSFGSVLPQTTTGFMAFYGRNTGSGSAGMLIPYKIAGTTITTGSTPLIITDGPASSAQNPSQLTNGTYVLMGNATGTVNVFSFNGDVVADKGSIVIPILSISSSIPQPVAGNRVVCIGTDLDGSNLTTQRFRVLNLEIAS